MYTSIDRVLASFSRNLKDSDVSESDLIEWFGEALGFLQSAQIQEQAIAFLEVRNYQADLPSGFYSVLQIGRNLKWNKEDKQTCIKDIVDEITEEVVDTPKPRCPVITDCQGNLIGDYEVSYYRPFFDLKWEYQPFIATGYYRQNFRPVRLANSTLYGNLVCNTGGEIYTGNEDEYTIIGTTDQKLRFSFEEGQVVMAYNRAAIDETTGYPLIPDDVMCITALTYYAKWKLAERLSWLGRQGYSNEAANAEQRWLKYARQYKNAVKMPKTLDDFQDHLEQTTTMLSPNRYYHFFGKTKRNYY